MLERLAGEILKNIFTEFSQIENINLKINKPGAPIKYHFEKCGVEVNVSREEFYNL
ncbi:dihydroneopterin aldolase [uncultured Leptotrichia sp.]|uniref:dihydroneopterin aldolase n=1 Tax=uncultured Leptotrichia sp. TaxID=159271 RepID=UPI00345CABC3